MPYDKVVNQELKEVIQAKFEYSERVVLMAYQALCVVAFSGFLLIYQSLILGTDPNYTRSNPAGPILAVTLFFAVLWGIWKYASELFPTQGAGAFIGPISIGLPAAIILGGIVLVLTSNHGHGDRIFEGIMFLVVLGGIMYGFASLVLSLMFVLLIRSLFKEIK
jgi:hypothetical protein